LKPFEIAIKRSNPWLVMTSYNLVNGVHSDMNKFLLEEVLRNQWRWKGLVISDWTGTNSLVESLEAGYFIPLRSSGLAITYDPSES
jgi:beta-glucosidase